MKKTQEDRITFVRETEFSTRPSPPEFLRLETGVGAHRGGEEVDIAEVKIILKGTNGGSVSYVISCGPNGTVPRPIAELIQEIAKLNFEQT